MLTCQAGQKTHATPAAWRTASVSTWWRKGGHIELSSNRAVWLEKGDVDPRLSLANIAARVGYESEAAFHRAFKRDLGEPPAAWRRRQAPHA